MQWSASAWSTTANAAVNQTFRMFSYPEGNDTATPSGDFIFQYQLGTVDTNVFSISSNGLMTSYGGLTITPTNVAPHPPRYTRHRSSWRQLLLQHILKRRASKTSPGRWFPRATTPARRRPTLPCCMGRVCTSRSDRPFHLARRRHQLGPRTNLPYHRHRRRHHNGYHNLEPPHRIGNIGLGGARPERDHTHKRYYPRTREHL